MTRCQIKLKDAKHNISVGVWGRRLYRNMVISLYMSDVFSGMLWRSRSLVEVSRVRACTNTWPLHISSNCWTVCWSRTDSPRTSTPTMNKGRLCGEQVKWWNFFIYFFIVFLCWFIGLFFNQTFLSPYLFHKVLKANPSPTYWSRKPAAWPAAWGSYSGCTLTLSCRVHGLISRHACCCEYSDTSYQVRKIIGSVI